MTNERRRRAHQSGGCFTIDKIQERGINAALRVTGSPAIGLSHLRVDDHSPSLHHSHRHLGRP
jgi:hypothetical protein